MSKKSASVLSVIPSEHPERRDLRVTVREIGRAALFTLGIERAPAEAFPVTFHRWACKRKVRYGHEESALKAADHMHNKNGDSFDAYSCDYCGCWHIGHSRI